MYATAEVFRDNCLILLRCVQQRPLSSARSARARGSGDPRTGPPDPLDSLPPSDAGDTPDPGGGISAPPKRGGPCNGITAQLPGAPGDAPSSSCPDKSSRRRE